MFDKRAQTGTVTGLDEDLRRAPSRFLCSPSPHKHDTTTSQRQRQI